MGMDLGTVMLVSFRVTGKSGGTAATSNRPEVDADRIRVDRHTAERYAALVTVEASIGLTLGGLVLLLMFLLRGQPASEPAWVDPVCATMWMREVTAT